MNRSVLVLIPVAALAACSSYEPVSPSPVATTVAPVTYVAAPAPAVVAAPPVAVVQQPAVVMAQPTMVAPMLRAGHGRVDSITPLNDRWLRRIGIRMEDGTMQYVDSRAQNLSVGEGVEITSDSHIRYPVAAR